MAKTVNPSLLSLMTHGQQVNSTHWNTAGSRGASQIAFGSCEPHQNYSKSKAKNAAVRLLGRADRRQRDDTPGRDVLKPRWIYLTSCRRRLKANPNKFSPTVPETISILFRQSLNSATFCSWLAWTPLCHSQLGKDLINYNFFILFFFFPWPTHSTGLFTRIKRNSSDTLPQKKSSSRVREQSQEDPDGFKAFQLIVFPHTPVRAHSCTAVVFINGAGLALPCQLISCHSFMTQYVGIALDAARWHSVWQSLPPSAFRATHLKSPKRLRSLNFAEFLGTEPIKAPRAAGKAPSGSERYAPR